MTTHTHTYAPALAELAPGSRPTSGDPWAEALDALERIYPGRVRRTPKGYRAPCPHCSSTGKGGSFRLYRDPHRSRPFLWCHECRADLPTLARALGLEPAQLGIRPSAEARAAALARVAIEAARPGLVAMRGRLREQGLHPARVESLVRVLTAHVNTASRAGALEYDLSVRDAARIAKRAPGSVQAAHGWLRRLGYLERIAPGSGPGAGTKAARWRLDVVELSKPLRIVPRSDTHKTPEKATAVGSRPFSGESCVSLRGAIPAHEDVSELGLLFRGGAWLTFSALAQAGGPVSRAWLADETEQGARTVGRHLAALAAVPTGGAPLVSVTGRGRAARWASGWTLADLWLLPGVPVWAKARAAALAAESKLHAERVAIFAQDGVPLRDRRAQAEAHAAAGREVLRDARAAASRARRRALAYRNGDPIPQPAAPRPVPAEAPPPELPPDLVDLSGLTDRDRRACLGAAARLAVAGSWLAFEVPPTATRGLHLAAAAGLVEPARGGWRCLPAAGPTLDAWAAPAGLA